MLLICKEGESCVIKGRFDAIDAGEVRIPLQHLSDLVKGVQCFAALRALGDYRIDIDDGWNHHIVENPSQ